MSDIAGDLSDVKTTSTSSFVSALVYNSSFFGVQAVAFFVVCRWFPKIYEPRTYLPADARDRSEQLEKYPWDFLKQLWRIDPTRIIEQNGLDAYMYLRFLLLCLRIFWPFWFLTWILLLPINRVNNEVQTGLYRYTFGNVSSEHTSRLWAHLCVMWALVIYVCLLLWKEMNNFVQLRIQFLTSKRHKKLAQSRTVLVLGLAKEFRHERSLRKLVDQLPGGSERIWLTRDIGYKIINLYDDQQAVVKKLESAEVKAISRAVKEHQRITKGFEKLKAKRPGAAHQALAAEYGLPDVSLETPQQTFDRLVPPKHRPRHKINKKIFLPCSGEVVDTIEWCKQELVRLTHALEEERKLCTRQPVHNSAFILFKTQMAAHMFAQTTSHNRPMLMTHRYVEVHEENVIFNNLAVTPLQRRVRYVLSWAGTLGIIISWSFPVAFVGSLSNVQKLCVNQPWIRKLCDLPTPINGIIQGILPAVALALLFMIPPFVFRTLSRFEGIPLESQIELNLMTRYFIFLIIQGFLVVTLSSGLISSLPVIASEPGSIANMLATNLPTASNFYLSYLATTGIGGTGSSLLQIVTLVLYFVFLFLLASTPRKVFDLKFKMEGDDWGTLFPSTTLYTVIGLTYTVIAPLLAAFAALLFFLFYWLYKYLLVFVWDFPAESETGGLFFPLAVHQVFTGLYIGEVCLAGLFFLVRDAHGKATCVVQGGLTVALIVLTILFHLLLTISYRPLITNLPLNMGVEITDDDMEETLAKKKAFTGFKEDPLSAFMDTSAIVGGKAAAVATKQVKNVAGATKQAGFAAASQAGKKAMDTAKAAGASVGFSGKPDHVDSQSAPSGGVHNADGQQYIEMNDISDTYRPEKDELDQDVDESEIDEHTFDHPATYEELQPIWLPADPLGIGELEVEKLRALGIEASTAGATMDHRGYVYVDRPPPGEDWCGSDTLPQPPKVVDKTLHKLHLDR